MSRTLQEIIADKTQQVDQIESCLEDLKQQTKEKKAELKHAKKTIKKAESLLEFE